MLQHLNDETCNFSMYDEPGKIDISIAMPDDTSFILKASEFDRTQQTIKLLER